mgnify:CR=1 FL=1
MVAALDEIQTAAIDLTKVPGQQDFVLDRRPRVVRIGGRGCAKSSSGVFKIIDYHGYWEGARGTVVAPSCRITALRSAASRIV